MDEFEWIILRALGLAGMGLGALCWWRAWLPGGWIIVLAGGSAALAYWAHMRLLEARGEELGGLDLDDIAELPDFSGIGDASGADD